MVLAVAALLRFACAGFSVGFDHPNEVYRLLEPLASMMGYSAHLPWEWTQGLLSKLPAQAHWEFLRVAAALGITGASAQAFLLRFTYALLALLPVAATWKLVRESGASRRATFAAALLVALWPEFVYQSVRLMDYSLEASFFALALILVFPSRDKSFRSRAATAAAVLGLLFFVRFQTGLHLISITLVLVAAAIWRRERYRWGEAAALVVAYGAVVGALGLWEAHGNPADFLLPFRNYLQFNGIEHGAEKIYGSAPWYRYLEEVWKYYGAFAALGLIGLSCRRKVDRRLLFLFLFPIVVHSLIAHKEGRFVYGALWLWVPAAFSGLDEREWRIRLAKPVAGVIGILFLAGFGVSGVRVARKALNHRSDVLAFTSAARTMDRLDSERKSTLVVKSDSVFSPGAFYLRPRGALCYAGERDHDPCPLYGQVFLLEPGDEDANETSNRSRTQMQSHGWTLVERNF